MDKWQITLRVEGIRREILQIREANRNYKAHTTHHVTTRTQEVHPNRMAKTILIADDSDVVRRAVCEAFALESDFEVCGEAHDGHDAIEKAQRLHPDLIILDLSMPVMNGFEAARVLRDLLPPVPIILFTLYGDVIVEERARSAGVADVVSKSEHISVLIDAARHLLYRNAA